MKSATVFLMFVSLLTQAQNPVFFRQQPVDYPEMQIAWKIDIPDPLPGNHKYSLYAGTAHEFVRYPVSGAESFELMALFTRNDLGTYWDFRVKQVLDPAMELVKRTGPCPVTLPYGGQAVVDVFFRNGLLNLSEANPTARTRVLGYRAFYNEAQEPGKNQTQFVIPAGSANRENSASSALPYYIFIALLTDEESFSTVIGSIDPQKIMPPENESNLPSTVTQPRPSNGNK